MLSLILAFLSISHAQAAVPAAVTAFQQKVGHAIPAEKPVRLEWKGEAYELKGTVEEDLSRTRWRTHLLLPKVPLEDLTILQDGKVIDHDMNGQVRELAKESWAKNLTQHALMSGAWLQQPGKFQELPADKQGRARVRWQPEKGAMAEITFGGDAFPAEWSYDTGGGQMQRVELSGWREDGGVYVPHGQVVHEPNLVVPSKWELERVKPFDDRPIAKPEPSQSAHFPKGQNSAVLPLSLFQGRYILVPVTMGDVHSIFVFDTGASSTTISFSLAKKLGLPLQGKLTQEQGMMKDFYFVRTPTIDIAGAQVDPQVVIAADLDSGEFGHAFPGVGGVLGYDFISRFVETIDYQDARLTFTDRTSFQPLPGDVSIPVKHDDAAMIIPVTVNGKQAEFLLDTGNGGNPVIQHVPGQEAWVAPGAKKKFYDPSSVHFGSGVGGAWQAYVSLGVGPFTWNRAPVSIVDEKAAHGGSFLFQGNVGATYLRQFRLTVDMGTPRLWLAQTVPFRDRPAVATYGFSLRGRPDGKIEIRSVSVGGAAARAGFHAGDLIETVNGMSAETVVTHSGSILSDPTAKEKLHLVGYQKQKRVNVTIQAEEIP